MLPEDLEKKLDEFTALPREVTGLLFYQPQNYPPRDQLCLIEGMFLTGVGTDEHVSQDARRFKVASEFLRRNPAYEIVEFHTHTRDTIAQYGNHYARNFSGADMDLIRENLRDNPNYIAMLVTPEANLLHGSGELKYSTVKDSQTHRKMDPIIQTAMEKIARNQGYELGTLRIQ